MHANLNWQEKRWLDQRAQASTPNQRTRQHLASSKAGQASKKHQPKQRVNNFKPRLVVKQIKFGGPQVSINGHSRRKNGKS